MMCRLFSIFHKGLDFTLDSCCGLTLASYFGNPEDLYFYINHVQMPFFKKSCFTGKAWLCPCILAWNIGKTTSEASLEPNWSKFFSGLHFLWYRLKELEEKSRKWESRPEDTHLINCLQDKLSEREEIIKQLVVRLVFYMDIRIYIIYCKVLFSVSHIASDWIFSFCSGIL